MAEGQVYAQVDASVVNGGIAPMAMVSSAQTPPEGQTDVTIWIRWRYENESGEGGYTGTGWYFNQTYSNGLEEFASEEAFKEYLVKNKPINLDNYLGNWSSKDKAAFLTEQTGNLFANGCIVYLSQS